MQSSLTQPTETRHHKLVVEECLAGYDARMAGLLLLGNPGIGKSISLKLLLLHFLRRMKDKVEKNSFLACILMNRSFSLLACGFQMSSSTSIHFKDA